MSVAKTKSSDKPCAAEILAAGEQLRQLADQLQGFVNSAAQEGESFGKLKLIVGVVSLAFLGPSCRCQTSGERPIHLNDER